MHYGHHPQVHDAARIHLLANGVHLDEYRLRRQAEPDSEPPNQPRRLVAPPPGSQITLTFSCNIMAKYLHVDVVICGVLRKQLVYQMNREDGCVLLDSACVEHFWKAVDGEASLAKVKMPQRPLSRNFRPWPTVEAYFSTAQHNLTSDEYSLEATMFNAGSEMTAQRPRPTDLVFDNSDGLGIGCLTKGCKYSTRIRPGSEAWAVFRFDLYPEIWIERLLKAGTIKCTNKATSTEQSKAGPVLGSSPSATRTGITMKTLQDAQKGRQHKDRRLRMTPEDIECERACNVHSLTMDLA